MKRLGKAEIPPAAGLLEANRTASSNPVRATIVAPNFELKRNLLAKSHFSSAC
jgi:hypothetical protein